MNTGAFGEGFPYSNFHELNMDWIVKIAKDFLDQYSHIQDTISNGLTELDEEAERLTNALDDWYNEHSEDIAHELTTALEVALTSFNSRANAKADQTISSIPDDYTALSNAVTKLQTDNNAFGNFAVSTLSSPDAAPYAGWWHIINGVATLEGNASYLTIENPVDVSNYIGCFVRVTASIINNYGIKIFDANYNSIQTITGNNAEEQGFSPSILGNTPHSVCVIVPKNAKYIASEIRSTQYVSMEQFNITAFKNDLTNRLIKVEDGITTDIITPSTEYNEYYVQYNNVLQQDPRFNVSEYVNVKPYSEITLDTHLGGSSAVCIVFVSDDKSYVVKSYNGEEVAGTVTLPVPDNAGWFRASYRNTSNGFTMKCLFNYISKTFELASAKNPSANPLSNIIHDGGFCKIFDTMGVVGDSLSSGAMSAPGDTVLPEDQEDTTDYFWYSWIQYMSRYCGNTAYNFSMGGLSAHGLRTARTTNPNVAEIYNRLMGNTQKCKAYFVALGHNDRNYATTHPEYVIGTIADCNLGNPESNADTYYGNYAWVISQIKNIQPHAKIFLITMKNSDAFSEYNEAIREMVSLFNTYYNNTDVYLIDMENAPFSASWEYTNGHGNTMGYLNYSWQISTYVDYIIRNNTEDFKLIQFIGTPYLP